MSARHRSQKFEKERILLYIVLYTTDLITFETIAHIVLSSTDSEDILIIRGFLLHDVG